MPYYDEGGITIYHGNCLEVMSSLDETFEMAFTSPPYNLGNTPGGGIGQKNDTKWRKASQPGGLGYGYTDHADDMPMDEYEDWQKSVLLSLWDHVTGAIFYNHKPRPWKGEVWLPLRMNPDLPLRQIIIWARAGGINFNASHYLNMHEWIMVFARPDWKLTSQGASGVGGASDSSAVLASMHKTLILKFGGSAGGFAGAINCPPCSGCARRRKGFGAMNESDNFRPTGPTGPPVGVNSTGPSTRVPVTGQTWSIGSDGVERPSDMNIRIEMAQQERNWYADLPKWTWWRKLLHGEKPRMHMQGSAWVERGIQR